MKSAASLSGSLPGPSQPPKEGRVSLESATLKLGRKEEQLPTAGGKAIGKHGSLIPSASR